MKIGQLSTEKKLKIALNFSKATLSLKLMTKNFRFDWGVHLKQTEHQHLTNCIYNNHRKSYENGEWEHPWRLHNGLK